LRRRTRPHSSLAIKHNLLLGIGSRLRESEASLEFVGGEVQCVGLGGERDVDCGGDDAGAGEFGGFANVD
jgi:hypothetical protein